MSDGNDLSLEDFFNNLVSDADGTLRNLRIKNASDPIDGYHISEQEMGTTAYFGYLNQDGGWYIQKAITTGAVIAYTYKKGTSGYSWAGRAGGTYASFDTTF